MDRNYRLSCSNNRFWFSAAVLSSLSALSEMPSLIIRGGIAQHRRGVPDTYYLVRKAGVRHCVKPGVGEQWNRKYS
jgi:hypothetical protein